MRAVTVGPASRLEKLLWVGLIALGAELQHPLFHGRQALCEDRLRGDRLEPRRTWRLDGADVIRSLAKMKDATALFARHAA